MSSMPGDYESALEKVFDEKEKSRRKLDKLWLESSILEEQVQRNKKEFEELQLKGKVNREKLLKATGDNVKLPLSSSSFLGCCPDVSLGESFPSWCSPPLPLPQLQFLLQGGGVDQARQVNAHWGEVVPLFNVHQQVALLLSPGGPREEAQQPPDETVRDLLKVPQD
eukprot:GFUD01066740.1.p1 GENE.GFUD01066740.1~~GFUD01066740.1.p1  ORF type:complete len:181 (-),score=43.54 GFUD01066740.1:135-635(-)